MKPYVSAVFELIQFLPRQLPGKERMVRALLGLPYFRNMRTVTGRHGLTYKVPSAIEPIVQGILAHGVYEPEIIATVLKHLPPGGVFVDVGANIGAICLPISRLRPDATVVAIEASPFVFKFLTENVERNQIRNVHALCAFVGDEQGSPIEFYEAPPERFGMGSVGKQFGHPPITLTQETLDGIVHQLGLPSLDVVKIDVEGAEMQVLRSAPHSLLTAPRRPVIVFEFLDWAEERAGFRTGASQDLLMKSGFDLAVVRSDGGVTAIQTPITKGGVTIVALPRGRQSGGTPHP